MFPDPWRSEWHHYHPLLEHLAHALERHGCSVIRSPEEPTAHWLWRAHNTIDVIHLHWPEQFYQTGTKYRVWIGIIKLWRFLAQVRLAQLPLIWTIHEVYPHSIYESRYPIWLHRYARRLLCQNADALTVNCHSARLLIERAFVPRSVVSVVELGNYSDFYPNTISRARARERLGLAVDTTMFLVFGTMRPHRNPVDVIRAFRQIDNSNARLFVVGQASLGIHAEVEREAWEDWRIRVFPYVIENDQIEIYFKACDVLVMPGKDYLTSAVVMLGLTYGKPVIAECAGCTPDMVGNAGLLYRPNDPDGLLLRMKDALTIDLAELGERARLRGEVTTWDRSAHKLSEIYASIISHKK